MADTSRRTLLALTRSWSGALLWCVLALAVVVMTGGWLRGNDEIVRLRADFAAMAPSTALCLILASAAALAAHVGRGGPNVLRAAAAVISFIAAADLAVILAGAATGIDAYLWPNAPTFETTSMAPATATCGLLAAACLFLRAPVWITPPPALYSAFGTAGLFIASIAIVGYAFDAAALYEVSVFTAMALHTALAFAALFTALLLARPDIGWVGVVLGEHGGSAGARRLLPIVILVPFALCLLALTATDLGLFSANFRLSLLAIVMMAFLGATVLYNAVLQNRVERRLLETSEDLEAAIAQRDLLMSEMNHRVKNNLQQINALLHFESTKLEDDRAQQAFRSMADRIFALGTVHTLLMNSARPALVDAELFISELCSGLSVSLGVDKRHVAIDSDINGDGLNLEFAMSLGLLINELVTNAYQHGFANRADGRILVRFSGTQEKGYVLDVVDDGEGFDFTGINGFPGATGAGAKIVRGLVAQLGGSFTVTSDAERGTSVHVRMPPASNEAQNGRRAS